MNSRLKSFIAGMNPKKLGFGIKINILVYLILLISFSVLSIVGLQLFKKHIHQVSYEKLEQVTYQKKHIVENKYNEFLKEIDNLYTDDFVYNAQELSAAFQNYSFERSASFESDSLEMSKILLKDYYESEVIESIKWDTPELNEIFPQRDIDVVLQRTFIRDNKWSVGEKDKLFDSKGGTSYDMYHQMIQPTVRSFARKYKVNNVYLIDSKTGDVFYNLNKNISFGTNLFTGSYKTSELSKLFQESLSSTAQNARLFFSDFTPFVPEQNRQVAYISKALIQYNDIVAIAIIELTPEFLQNIVFDVWLEQNWNTMSINILGSDNKFKLNDLEQYVHPVDYFSKLKKRGITNEVFMQAALVNGGAGVLGINAETQQTTSDLSITTDYAGEEYLYLSQLLNVKGFNWSIFGGIPVEANKKIIASVRRKILIVFVVLLLMSTFMLRGFISSVLSRLNLLRNAFVKLSKGEVAKFLETPIQDELGKTIGVFNILNERIEGVGSLAMQLSEGNYDKSFEASSENDELAHALNTLGKSLKKNSEQLALREIEDRKVTWLNEGVAKFNDLLRKSNNDIKELAYIVIENMVSYLEMVQGGVFLVDGETDDSKTISLIASFAYDRRKYNKKTIEIGEGLIGNCYLEKKSVHLNNIPEGYLELSSGLGSAQPHTLYIVPLTIDGNILGFIEMASLNNLESHQVDFIEKLAENIAATFATVKLNTRTAELLEESKRRANEITQQEEEMRQNMEEMLATQEELSRIREEDEKKSNELQNQINSTSGMLQSVLNSIKGEVIVKDSHGVIVLANTEACLRYETTIDKIKGQPDSEILDKTILESEHELDQTAINEGEYIGYRTENVNGTLVEYVLEKRVFTLENEQEPGVITFWLKGDKTD